MKSRPPADHHLDSRTALDYLDRTLGEAAGRQVEAHLGLPCPVCRERIRALGALIQRMRLDRVPPVPDALRARALEVFAPVVAPSPVERIAEQVARLLFDSWAAPLPAAVRRAVGEARRLRFALAQGSLGLECETESPGLVTLRGRLDIEDAPLHRVEIVVGTESRSARPDAGGAFALERVPAGEARLSIAGPSGRHRVPPITL